MNLYVGCLTLCFFVVYSPRFLCQAQAGNGEPGLDTLQEMSKDLAASDEHLRVIARMLSEDQERLDASEKTIWETNMILEASRDSAYDLQWSKLWVMFYRLVVGYSDCSPRPSRPNDLTRDLARRDVSYPCIPATTGSPDEFQQARILRELRDAARNQAVLSQEVRDQLENQLATMVGQQSRCDENLAIIRQIRAAIARGHR